MSYGQKKPIRDFVYCCIFKQSPHLLKNNQSSKINPVPLQSRRCRKTQSYIRPHIPTLVYCEVFTNMCFNKDIRIWRATRKNSHQSQCWALYKKKVIQDYQTGEQKLPQVDNNMVCIVFKLNGPTLSHNWSVGQYFGCAACLGSVIVSFFTLSHKSFGNIQTRNSWVSDTKTVIKSSDLTSIKAEVWSNR